MSGGGRDVAEIARRWIFEAVITIHIESSASSPPDTRRIALLKHPMAIQPRSN
ncbi:hypothetical protein Arad_7167 [Rhizobium rhizogenes K84]|uniref:Uncharacterized protein n=1 Tax=Rhizobium rhizogenes (strain K84 / ATCC BAA-868) TaxID=311403 RepID=B9JM15_RHIR8|nr:hypothetical protein Arad_7167 [Rhizobium rhizogenes K84]